ncbi:MAG: anhydro-N-acetylmuramic acid kinase [Comamonadaceae bacterium]|nr:MAG: anhydro-N-acetylmuramic acid kinase [Comamonadaceae bacterium]
MNAPCTDGFYIGLMSGTSTDGADAVLARFCDGQPPAFVADTSVAMPQALRNSLLALNTPGENELHRAALAANDLAHVYAQAVDQVLNKSGISRKDIIAIGSHGQTVRHQPGEGYTTQLNAPAVLAERTGIAVVSDFRSRDVAAGGQGAPLVPAFHAALFSSDQPRVILNLGGIANITALAPGCQVTGFDTGPANVLLDGWCQRHLNHAYDEGGQWAASGTCHAGLLAFLLDSEPWLRAAPPKSTGRDLFNMPWLLERLAAFDIQHPHARVTPESVQATLSAFTARTVADAIKQWATHPAGGMWVAGGGAFNPVLMRDISREVGVEAGPTDELGVPAQALEAYAFAWLAYAHCAGVPGNRPEVTGAKGLRILGAYTPA